MENDLRYFISIKAIQQEALGFHMFYRFNISRHIGISVLFLIISVSCFVGFFLLYFRKYLPRGWGFSTIFMPERSGFSTFFVPCGIHSFKTFPGVGEGGMVRLGIDRYITELLHYGSVNCLTLSRSSSQKTKNCKKLKLLLFHWE